MHSILSGSLSTMFASRNASCILARLPVGQREFLRGSLSGLRAVQRGSTRIPHRKSRNSRDSFGCQTHAESSSDTAVARSRNARNALQHTLSLGPLLQRVRRRLAVFNDREESARWRSIPTAISPLDALIAPASFQPKRAQRQRARSPSKSPYSARNPRENGSSQCCGR